MDLRDALRTTGSVRAYRTQPVDDTTIYEILDDARFAPSGGNRQSWRVIIVRNPELRRTLRDVYLEGWHEYVAHVLAGLVPFSPLASAADRELAVTKHDEARARFDPQGFAETLDQCPVLLLVCADLGVLAAVDRDLPHYSIAGGGSVYPFIWNILLAARSRGLGGVMTTMATRHEELLRAPFAIPDNFVVASVVALGYPAHQPTKLRRRHVEEFTVTDRFDGEPFVP